jgi:hypothetical protein
MWVDERARAGQVGFAVRASNDACGLFEPFRRILVRKGGGRPPSELARPLRWRVRGLGTWGDLPLGADFFTVAPLTALAKAAVVRAGIGAVTDS